MKLGMDTGTRERKKTFFTAERRNFWEKASHRCSQKIQTGSEIKVLYRAVWPSV